MNSLPAATVDFDTRIVIVMPSPMTQDSADPVIKILDDYLQDPAITRIDDSDPEGYPGCGTSGSSARVCYSITHTGP